MLFAINVFEDVSIQINLDHLKILDDRERENIMREQILNAIDNNSKLTAKDISLMLGVDEAAVAAEIKAMEEEAVICGYPTLINWDKTDKDFDDIRERVRLGEKKAE